jgi:hypothetical protein
MTLDFIIKLVAVIAFVVVLVAIEAVAMCFLETIKETSENYIDEKIKERTGEKSNDNN